MCDVYFYEAFEEEARFMEAFLPPKTSFKMTPKTIQETGAETCPSALISVRTQSVIPQGWAARLKGILTRSTGYDHLLAYQRSTGADLPCGYLPSYCSRAVAEQAVMLLLSLWRKQKQQIKNLASFDRDGLTGKEIKGKKLLVVGAGRIGAQVADIGKGLRMEVKGVDIDPRQPDLAYVSLGDGLAWADAIVCALSLNSSTRGLLNYQRLKSARTGSLFINIARGEISPVSDLERLLREGRLGGVGLDVYDEEAALAGALRSGQTTPRTKQILALARQDNVILTPHNAFNTEEAVRKKAEESAKAVEEFLRSGTFPDLIPKDEGRTAC